MSGAPTANQSERELKTTRTLNTIATVGAGHALYSMTPEKSREAARERLLKIAPEKARPGARKVLATLKQPEIGGKLTRAGKVVAGGWLTLHGAELAGDVMARRSINNQLAQVQARKNKGSVVSVKKNDASIMSAGYGAVRSNGRGVNLEEIDKAFSKHPDRRDTYYVPGYGEQHGTVYGTESTRGERRLAAGASGVVGGIGGGLFGAALHAKRGGSGRLGAVLGAAGGATALGALAHRGSKYKSEFRLDDKKVSRAMGDYMRSAPQDRLSVTQERQLKQNAHRATIEHNNRHRLMTYRQLANDVSKAYRRVDPEADRQRRIGAYAAGSGVGAAWAGKEASRHLGVERIAGEKALKIKPSRKGVGLAALSAGLGAAGIGSYRHGISVRNQPWT
jgi:hypothetical protein